MPTHAAGSIATLNAVTNAVPLDIRSTEVTTGVAAEAFRDQGAAESAGVKANQNELRILSTTSPETVRSTLARLLPEVGLEFKDLQARGAMRGQLQGVEFKFKVWGSEDLTYTGFLTDGGKISLQQLADGAKALICQYGDQSYLGNREMFANTDFFVKKLDGKNAQISNFCTTKDDGSGKMELVQGTRKSGDVATTQFTDLGIGAKQAFEQSLVVVVSGSAHQPSRMLLGADPTDLAAAQEWLKIIKPFGDPAWAKK